MIKNTRDNILRLASQLRGSNGDKRTDNKLSVNELISVKQNLKNIVFDSNDPVKNVEDGIVRVKCCYCNKMITLEETTLEHKFPQCFGGAYVLNNLAPCCAPCNQERAIMFSNSGDIINIGHFKVKPLKTNTRQEKLAAIALIHIYAYTSNIPVEKVDLTKALMHYYAGIQNPKDLSQKLPKSLREIITFPKPWYMRIFYFIKGIFSKK